MLNGFLLSRSPTRGFSPSNGHGRRQEGRAVVSRQGNLVVEPKLVVPVAELRRMLREEAKRQGKLYGLSFRDISGGFTNTARGGPQAFKVLPILVYRVWVDGRPDELVRGVDLVGTPLAALSKIMAAADDYQTFNGYCGAESGFVPVSATSPSLLVQQIEVERRDKGSDKPPVLPAPALAPAPPRRPARRGRREPAPTASRRWASLAAALVRRRRGAGRRRRRSPAAPPIRHRARGAHARNAETVQKAMQDELARSMAELHLGDEPRPYYLALHGLGPRSGDGRARRWGRSPPRTPTAAALLRTDLRVGDASFDNTNFEGGPRVETIPLEDDYAALRRELWLRTDEAYKTRDRDAGAQARGGGRAGGGRGRRVGRRLLEGGRRAPRDPVPRAGAPIRRRCARRCAGCRCCWPSSPQIYASHVTGTLRDRPAAVRVERGHAGSTTTSARCASTSSPTPRPTTA